MKSSALATEVLKALSDKDIIQYYLAQRTKRPFSKHRPAFQGRQAIAPNSSIHKRMRKERRTEGAGFKAVRPLSDARRRVYLNKYARARHELSCFVKGIETNAQEVREVVSGMRAEYSLRRKYSLRRNADAMDGRSGWTDSGYIADHSFHQC